MSAISIIIPVYNEEQILVSAVQNLVHELLSLPLTYEIILCENGSRDNTELLARQLSMRISNLRVLRLPKPSYGHALKAGIEHARFDRLVLLNLDLCDIQFLSRAMLLLDQYDCVVGSKVAPGSKDERPFVRRQITWLFNTFLRLTLGFKGSDTHGVKAFRRHRVLPLAHACVTDAELFDTELVLRAHRQGLTWFEIPVAVRECRPARTSVLARACRTIPELTTLLRACCRHSTETCGEDLNAYDCERVTRLSKHFTVDEIVELTLIPRHNVTRYMQGSAQTEDAWSILSLAK